MEDKEASLVLDAGRRSQRAPAVVLALVLTFLGGVAYSQQPSKFFDIKAAMQEVAIALFAPQTDLWTYAQQKNAGKIDLSCGAGAGQTSGPKELKIIAPLPLGQAIKVYDQTFIVALSNLAPLILENDLYRNQPLVQNQKGQYVIDREFIFKALAAWRVRDYFKRVDRKKAAQNFLAAAQSLDQAKEAYKNANYAGIAQQVLTEVVSHQITGQPYNPMEAMNPETSRSINAALGAMEISRYTAELRQMAQWLKDMDPASLTYEQASLYYATFADCAARIGPLSTFADATFPASKETWSKRTLNMLVSDITESVPFLGPLTGQKPPEKKIDPEKLLKAIELAEKVVSSKEATTALKLLLAAGQYDETVTAYISETSDPAELVPVSATYSESSKIITALTPFLKLPENQQPQADTPEEQDGSSAEK